MVPVFRNISLALAKDSNSSQLIAIRCCLFFKKNLNKSKGAGLDEISCRLILDCADLSASHILIIFKSSLAISRWWEVCKGYSSIKRGKRS